MLIAHGRKVEMKANFKMVRKVGLAKIMRLMLKIFILGPLMVPRTRTLPASAKSLEVELNLKSTTVSALLLLQLEE